MSSHLYLRAISEKEFQWLFIDQGSRQNIEQGEIGQLQNYLNAQGVHEISATFFMHTELSAVIKAKIPSSQTSNLTRLLPIALEEEIAQNVDDCDFKALNKPNNGEVWTCVISKGLIEQIVVAFADINVHMIHLTLDAQYASHDINPELIAITLDEDRILIKNGIQVFALPFDQLSQSIAKLHIEGEAERDIELYYQEDDERISIVKAQLEVAGHTNVNLNVIKQPLLAQMADHYITTKHHLNLLNSTQSGNEALVARIKVFSTLIAASLAALICIVTLNYMDSGAQQQKVEALWLANSKIIEQAVPELKNKKNRIVRQLKNELANFDDIKAPVVKLSAIDPISEIAVLKRSIAFSINEIRFSAKNQDWYFTLTARNDSLLEKISTGMTSKGYDAIFTSQKNESGKVKGILKVSTK
ncbi:MAG: hypothetical protein HRU38_21220 [Saccharospirillaceae bacterium]|nr:hypothetical protein [Pseudomonadales bacterium]NRB81154.1 hypothetical protein [Saccharospirillaceae bacterium]